MSSLHELHTDVINNILDFLPSIWQLFQFELTSKRFQALVHDHMKKMTVVDLRTPAILDTKAMEEMEQLVCKRFSDRLTKLICVPHHNIGPCLMEAHPQLFLAHLTRLSNMEDNDRQRAARKVYDILTKGIKKSVESAVVIAQPERLILNARNLKACSDFIMNDKDKELMIQELSSVKEIRIDCFECDDEVLFETLPTGSLIFVGLKRILLFTGLLQEQLDLDRARRFKDLAVNSTLDIHFETDNSAFEHSGDVVVNLLGPHISSFIISTDTVVQLSSLTNLGKLDIDCSVTTNIIYNRIPSSVKDLRLTFLGKRHTDNVSQFLEARGQQLLTLSLQFARRYVKSFKKLQIARLLNAIAQNCTSLKTLCLDDYVSDNQIEELGHFLANVGPRLTNLKMTCLGADIRLVETVIMSCKNLKNLDLIIGHRGDADMNASCEKLKMMLKLVTARINIGVVGDSMTKITYRNYKLVCAPKLEGEGYTPTAFDLLLSNTS